jgi:hypothetical protein
MKRKLLSSTPPAHAALSGIVNVRDFGAKGDGRTDDTEAFQATINSLDKSKNKSGWSKSGGVVLVPNGWFKVKGPLDINHGSIRIEGTGGPSIVDRPCWVHFTGTRGPLFRFAHDARSPGGFSLKNILLAGQGASLPTSAFELWTGPRGNFRQNLSWDNVGVCYFGKAFTVKRKPGSGTQVGTLDISRCNFSNCDQAVVFADGTSVNRMTIRNSIMRQCRPKQSKPALDIRAFGFVIRDTNLEGNPFALLVRKSENVSIRDNFFEGNQKIAVRVTGSTDVVVDNNRCYGDYAGKFEFVNSNRLRIYEPEERIVLENCRDVTGPVMDSRRVVVSTEKSK